MINLRFNIIFYASTKHYATSQKISWTSRWYHCSRFSCRTTFHSSNEQAYKFSQWFIHHRMQSIHIGKNAIYDIWCGINGQGLSSVFKWLDTSICLATHLGFVLTWTDVYVDGVIHNSSGCPVGNQVAVDTWSAQCTISGGTGNILTSGPTPSD